MKSEMDFLKNLKDSENVVRDWPAWKKDIWQEEGRSARLIEQQSVEFNQPARGSILNFSNLHHQK